MDEISIPPLPDVEPYGTCDMGGCHGPAAVWVYDPDVGWLPACSGCDPSKPKPAPPAPSGHRCSCCMWFDAELGGAASVASADTTKEIDHG